MISPREERSLLEVGLESLAKPGGELGLSGCDVFGFSWIDLVVVEFGEDRG